ncbi:MAG: cytochrome c biogenesis heme-transporting ATPase CcmA [Rhodocyclaceae bacterium]|nr:cytochrome c biogenesis heme-transporting ATPase CcmA [Rhodocyclaceae bacterium]
MLEVTDLACLRGDRMLFADVALTVAAGELVRIAGPNGVGKTSLLRLLCGLAVPEHGAVRWKGERIDHNRDAFHRELLYLGHAAALNDLLSPLENLRFTATTHGHPADVARCEAALTRIGLEAQRDLPAKVLSQGQRRRVGLARLYLSEDVPLWVLDEPFTALDVDAVRDLADWLDAHCARGGMVVMTTHQDVPFATPLRVFDLAASAC